MLKRYLFIILATLMALPVFADSAAINNIDIDVVLNRDGSADITEVWDVNVASGTEWYLTRNNLGDIDILNLAVSDERGRSFIVEDRWDVQRTISQKEGRCGLNSTSYGCEICWGVGSYGPHVFTVSYTMTNVVKSLSDYDMLHMQFISPGLSSEPKKASVHVRMEGENFDESNSRIWGFGYYGDCNFQEDGTVLAKTSKSIPHNGSMIVLMRFNKGIFSSQSTQDRSFDDVLERAMVGADFKEQNREDDTAGIIIGILLAILALCCPILAARAQRRSVIGKMKTIDWFRDVPMDGDLVTSDYVLKKALLSKNTNSLASALILRMIYQGYLNVTKNADGKVDISFNDYKSDQLTGVEAKLYRMMKDASGMDQILQDKEFSNWSRRNTSRVSAWASLISTEGLSKLMTKGYVRGMGRFTDEGKAKARELVGFKKFLEEFTLVSERETMEVTMWQDYLVFASLFGIADKVAKQLQDINPQAFEEQMVYDYTTMRNILYQTRNLSNSITNAQQREAASKAQQASKGFGGGASFGGGGGFSGGGFGGGSR